MQHITVFQNQCLCLCITLVDNPVDFSVDLPAHQLAVGLCMRQIPSDEHFIIVIIIADHTYVFRHSVPCYHLFRNLCRLFDITGCAGGNIIKNNFFRDSSAQGYHNLLQHATLCHKHIVTLRQRHRITSCTCAGRNDRHRINRSDIRQHMEQNRMSGFVIRCDLTLFIRNNTALSFCSDSYFYKSSLDILLTDKAPVSLCCYNCRLV